MKLEYKSYFKTKENFKIYYETNFDPSVSQKNNIVLVFNYGLVCNFEHFKYQITYFKKLNYNILIHDYRFHFKSSSSKKITDCTFSGITQDLNQLLTHIENPKIILIGHSMGVNINLEYSYRYPQKIIGQVLISGTYTAPQKIMFHSNIIEHVQPILEKAAQNNPNLNQLIWKTNHNNILARKFVHILGFHYKNVSDQFVKTYIKKIGELDPNLFFQLLNEMKNQDLSLELKKIKTKTLVMAGDKDYIIPIRNQKDLANNLINSKFYIIKNGSHVPQVDFHQTVNQTITFYMKNYFNIN